MAKRISRVTRIKRVTTIADLTPDASNARNRTERSHGMIVDSIHEVGLARSVVCDEAARILAGNGTVAGALEAGMSKVQVVDADGETLVVVRRIGLTEDQKTRCGVSTPPQARTANVSRYWRPDGSCVAPIRDGWHDGVWRRTAAGRSK